MLEIKFDDSLILATLAKLKAKTGDIRPALTEIKEELIDSVKERFATSTGPDGQKWAANAESVIAKTLSKTQGNYKKNGERSAAGKRRAGNKKPLIGETRTLSGTIYGRVRSDSLRIGSNAIYSRVQQYGASRGAFGSTKRGVPIPWGDIPARPYLGFSAEDTSMIERILKGHLSP